jgi:hypothetical protein
LLDDAPMFGPVTLQGKNKVLKCHACTSGWGECLSGAEKKCI